ncbi:MAG: hypothetical protein QF473_15160 [Planctomycetota bacterium]|nr:hypothetical protein [Planctomycetota bacterium]
MNFSGAARDLYRRSVHPRVMLGLEDLARLKDQIRRGAGKKIMEAIRRKALLDLGPYDSVSTMGVTVLLESESVP